MKKLMLAGVAAIFMIGSAAAWAEESPWHFDYGGHLPGFGGCELTGNVVVGDVFAIAHYTPIAERTGMDVWWNGLLLAVPDKTPVDVEITVGSFPPVHFTLNYSGNGGNYSGPNLARSDNLRFGDVYDLLTEMRDADGGSMLIKVAGRRIVLPLVGMTKIFDEFTACEVYSNSGFNLKKEPASVSGYHVKGLHHG